MNKSYPVNFLAGFLCFASILLPAAGTLAVARERNTVTPADPNSNIAIVGGRLIDGNGGTPLEDSCVVVKGNRIVAVGRRGQTDIPDNATVIDASGKSVLPGLFDTHFHSRDSVELPIEFELNNGITSFRDPGHPFKYYTTLLATEQRIPRVFLCGGHLDAPPVVWPDQARVITSAEEAKEAVRRNVGLGASAIKVYFRLPLEHIRAACVAAK